MAAESRPPQVASDPTDGQRNAIDAVFRTLDRARDGLQYTMRADERGQVVRVSGGVSWLTGLPGVGLEELVRFDTGALGLVLDLGTESTGVVLLDPETRVEAGLRARRTNRVMDVPVGDALLGRVVDAIGRPLDDGAPIRAQTRRPVERRPPAIMDRAPVDTPLQTGIKVIDALVPIGRGQRELIVGDRQTGKTTVAVDTILNQRDSDMVCVYCAIGQQTASVAKVIAQLRDEGALGFTTVVVATGEDPVGLRYLAPYAATSMAEHMVEEGKDVLIVYDDLTRHARAYRELSLLLRRPPGREAYPGDIFYIHSRLLERAAHLSPDLGGGSLTALPIVETQAENLSAYIPTNLVSITDGQVYLSPRLFRSGQLPAVDVGLSVSRVGGRAQLPAYRSVAGPLRLSYAQFEELERFTRYGAHLEEGRQHDLDRGRRVREIFKQRQGDPRSVLEQLVVLTAVADGVLDDVPAEAVAQVEARIRERSGELEQLGDAVANGDELDDHDRRSVRDLAGDIVRELQ
jgi:F-type H+-transporting ATPase subunit alpha